MERFQMKSPIQLYALLISLLLLLTTLLSSSILNTSSSDGLFSKLLLVHHLPNNPASKNISKLLDSKVEAHSIPNAEKPYDDMLLGGLLVAGLNESSCLSRYHHHLMYSRNRTPSPQLISRLRNYEALYKQCGPNTEAYNKTLQILMRRIKPGEAAATNCKYVIWTPLAGLGNRMITLASTFLYALLTNRVLFIVQEDNIPDLFCEPFPEVSWLLPSHFPIISEFYKLSRFHPHSYGNMLKNHSVFHHRRPPFVYLHLAHDFDDHDKLFFCDKDQAYLQNIPWLIVKSDQYFVPGLFLIQSFQQELNSLFPEKEAVFHHLGRYLFHPTNSVWGLITRYYETYLAKADEILLGLQIREFHDRGHNVTFDTILNQILACTINHNLLPQINKTEINTKVSSSSSDVVVENEKTLINTNVLVTSLNSGYYEKLRDMYWEYGTVTGEVIAFHQPSHEENQKSGNQMHDRKALAEVYLLSMSDKLVTSGWSTFGYVAQSLGGLQPWILYTPMDGNVPDPPCQLALSMEPCFHFAPSHLSCRKPGKGIETSNIVPHVKHCEDVGMGLKLFDRNY